MNTEYFDSSLKHFNFKGWTADQILEKYESVLASREKQITDLSIEMGSINDKLNILTEQVERKFITDKTIGQCGFTYQCLS